jgi:hypothetical protein
MIQATDGNWYAYFADRKQAQIADQTVVDAGTINAGLDFGTFCRNDRGQNVLNVTLTETTGFAIPVTILGGVQGTTPLATAICSDDGLGNQTAMNVVREPKEPNPGSGTTAVPRGQIGLNGAGADSSKDGWPFIQLYDFSQGGNVVVQYNKGGGVQSTTLKFDTVKQFAKLDLDRTTYPLGAQIHVTITDLQLNIDPTDEDSWTFGTNAANATSSGIYYQLFNENGNTVVNAANQVINIKTKLSSLMFEDNGVLNLNPAVQGTPILTIQDNDKTNIVYGGDGTNSAANANLPGPLSAQLGRGSQPVTVTETGPNTGLFGTYDESDKSTLSIVDDGDAKKRGKSASIEYVKNGKSIVVGFGFATLAIKPVDAEWNSGEEIPVVLTDSDANKNSRADEDLNVYDPNVSLIPSLRIGTPFTLGASGVETAGSINAATFTNAPVFLGGKGSNATFTINAGKTLHGTTVNKYSDRAMLDGAATAGVRGLVVTYEKAASDLQKVVMDTRSNAGKRLHGFDFFNYDIRGINTGLTTVNTYLAYSNGTAGLGAGTPNFRVASISNNTGPQGLINLNNTRAVEALYNMTGNGRDHQVAAAFTFDPVTLSGNKMPVIADFFSFGYINDGIPKADRVNNMIIRIQVKETGDNTGVFEGSLEYVMLNQLNILDAATYQGLKTITDDPTFVVHEDLVNERSPRVNYNDLGADGVVTQVSAQQAAPTHSGRVSFDSPTYKVADTVTITLEDLDLNTDSKLVDIYTVVNKTGDRADSRVGAPGLPVLTNGNPLGRLLDVEFDDRKWVDTNNACSTQLQNAGINFDLFDTGFTLIETGSATGIFKGDFQVPSKVCRGDDKPRGKVADANPVNSQGLNMRVTYVDYRDASGQIIEVGDRTGVRANTGSVKLDRTVYPVPWGSVGNFDTPSDDTAPSGRSIFPVHLTGITADKDNAVIGNNAAKTLGNGALTLHIDVNDPDFDVSASGEDTIGQNSTDAKGNFLARGPVKVSIIRGTNSVILGYAGGDTANNGRIFVGTPNADTFYAIRQLGPITETAPSSGIFEFKLGIQYTDGPASPICPATDLPGGGYNSLVTPGTLGAFNTRFLNPADPTNAAGLKYCILQGDVIQVEYTDPSDASGKQRIVTDSATFDLRNGALQSDKSVYIIGSDMILTLIDPDLDRDSHDAETYSLDLIEWDSAALRLTMGALGGSGDAFRPEPKDFRETGKNTGIFQSVIEIPRKLGGKDLNRGEEIVLEYTDWGPAGSKFVGDEKEDINLTIFTSNFGASIELDQKVYSWTDKAYITVIAPDHNFNSNLIDEIGGSNVDPLKVATRGFKLDKYKLVETGPDTGIFTGEVILTGFAHDADGNKNTGAANGFDAPTHATGGAGPTGGFLETSNDDGLTVSYEFSERETVVGSALIRWNIGEVSWLEASYPAKGTGVVRVIDPDMNLNPEAIDNFKVNVWSDSDAGGISLTVTETNEATGIFEGTVFFTTTDSSSGSRLRVAEGDTVTAEYKDNTLPAPYTRADELNITGTSFIGTVVPPLERAPASNPRVVDSFGNTINKVSVDQQVQITADLTNGQDREQAFAYLVQIQDNSGVTVSLAWITGSLTAGQSFSPALSWTPTASGTYTATVFVWESVDNPTALSPTVSVDINVS